MFRDVTFLYEGTGAKPVPAGGAPVIKSKFQGLYAFRHDGATLLDVFSLGGGDKPETRLICSILHGQSEMLNASPDLLMPRVRDRIPSVGRGGPGLLNRPDASERIFLAWYFRSLGAPAEHEPESRGWGEIEGRRCLQVRMLRQPRSSLKSWVGGLPFVKLWIDLERDGYPLRLEYYRGEDLEMRTEIIRMVQLPLPTGRRLWFPAEGKSEIFRDFRDGKWFYQKGPLYIETHSVVRNTVRFDQGLGDNFFLGQEASPRLER